MGEDGTTEERIKSLLGDSSDRGGLVRRRIVRRPLSGYQAQPIVFSEVSHLPVRLRQGQPFFSSPIMRISICVCPQRDAPPALVSGDPLSEMLMHLAATRKGALSFH